MRSADNDLEHPDRVKARFGSERTSCEETRVSRDARRSKSVLSALRDVMKKRILSAVEHDMDPHLKRIPFWTTLSTQTEYSARFSSIDCPIGADDLPVPPPRLRQAYQVESDADYIAVGREEATLFQNAMDRYVPGAHALLDFGSSSGRILRHYVGLERYSDLVGVDIDTPAVEWALAFLPERLKFVPISTFPSLPFEDGRFDVAIARSVFSHIRDLALMTLLEIGRTLRTGGCAFLTVLDDHSWRTYAEDPEKFRPGTLMHRIGVRHESFASTEIPGDFVLQGFGPSSMIFYRESYLRRAWGRFFDVLDITPFGARYTPQSLIVLRKKERPGDRQSPMTEDASTHP